MSHEDIIAYCLLKPEATLDHPFGPDSTIIKVNKKIFAQVFHLRGVPMATFNCDAMTGAFYRGVYPDAVARGYHCPPIQQPYFNTVRLDAGVPPEEIMDMIDHAYQRVVGRLPRAERERLAALLEECDPFYIDKNQTSLAKPIADAEAGRVTVHDLAELD